jgi:hypothetical protein
MKTIQGSSMNSQDLDKFKENYAELIVDGMDMKTLCTFAVETIIHNMETWDEKDLKEEILDLYDEEILMDLMPSVSQEPTEIGKLEATAPDYGVGK